MEHFANGIAIERKAIDIPDFVIDELLAMCEDALKTHYILTEETAIHKDSGVVYPRKTQLEWPTIIHPHYPPPGIPRSQAFSDFWTETENKIYKHVLKYLEEYPVLIHSLWWRDKGHCLVYEPGGHLQFHQDNNVGYSWSTRDDVVGRCEVSARNVLTVTLHVDDCEGGDMNFRYAGVRIPPRRGDLLIFPANYLGAHEVVPVKEGSRRISYLGWFGQGSTEPLTTPQGEGVIPLRIDDPDMHPESNFLWQKHIEKDFLASCGWTIDQIKEKYPAWGSQQAAPYWPTHEENEDS
jgi:hypothetical protein